MEEALAGRRCEQLLEKDDDCRQIIASPVEQDGQIAGAVLVILDVTEKGSGSGCGGSSPPTSPTS